MKDIPLTWIIAGGAVAAAVAFVAIKGAKGAGYAAGSAAVDLVEGAFVGTVETVGEKIWIAPKTDLTRCEMEKAAGNTFQASRYCPAGDFLKYLWG